MALFFYNFSLWVFGWISRFAASFNPKAKARNEGLVDWKSVLQSKLSGVSNVIWIHCASLGEYELIKPLISKIRSGHPDYQILLTFFSSSGYNNVKADETIHTIAYLPLDNKRNASDFLNAFDCRLALFSKYEWWYHYMDTLKEKKIPFFMVSAGFRKGQAFFKWYGGLLRKMLSFPTGILLQDHNSEKLLSTVHLKNNISVTGDMRFDRVFENSLRTFSNEQEAIFTEFCDNHRILVSGSSHDKEDELLDLL